MESSYFHLQLNENENPLVQSEVPWQGPFHVSYNAQQNIVTLNHAFFEQLYKAVFGPKKPLAKKPKPYCISTLITMAFGGWTVVRCSVGEVSELQRHPICTSPQSLR